MDQYDLVIHSVFYQLKYKLPTEMKVLMTRAEKMEKQSRSVSLNISWL